MPTSSRLTYDNDYWHSKQPFYARPEANWRQHPPPSDDTLLQTVLLVGDTGHPKLDGQDPVLNLIAAQAAHWQQRMTAVFLGDNIYPKGLPPEGHRLRDISEQRLTAQLDVFAGFRGRLVFLSGNHDWNRGKSDGHEYVLRQEEFVRNHTGRKGVYLPANGCPGPEIVELSDTAVMLVINTQWWVQRGFRPAGAAHGCAANSEAHVYELLKAALAAHKHKRILVAGHHPLYSNALHGGRFTLRHHLFPLTALHKKLYVPLPVAGSLYPLYRRLFGASEDMSHRLYRNMRDKLRTIFRAHENLVYAAGHDHNLQYFHRKGNHYIVSGSGSKTSFVHKGGKASFTHAHRGCVRMDEFSNGQWWLRVLEPADASGTAVEVFSKRIA